MLIVAPSSTIKKFLIFLSSFFEFKLFFFGGVSFFYPKSQDSRHNSLLRQNSITFGTYFTQAMKTITHALHACFYVFLSLWETLNHSMCAESSNSSIKKKELYFLSVSRFRCIMSGVRCQVSGFTCCMSHVTRHMSITPTATATEPSTMSREGRACYTGKLLAPAESFGLWPW